MLFELQSELPLKGSVKFKAVIINELVDRDDKDREIVCHMMKIVYCMQNIFPYRDSSTQKKNLKETSGRARPRSDANGSSNRTENSMPTPPFSLYFQSSKKGTNKRGSLDRRKD